jgi:hypothetical protein
MIVANTLQTRCWRQLMGFSEIRQSHLDPNHRQSSDHDRIRQHYPAFDRSLEVESRQMEIHLELDHIHARQGWKQGQEIGELAGNQT